jgi:UDP-N-acetylmuramate dehydrogenase
MRQANRYCMRVLSLIYMPVLQKNVSLLPYNTFKINVTARQFTVLHTINDALELISSELFRQSPRLILGGGSNILFTKNVDGLVIKNELTGIYTEEETDSAIRLKVGSGENWHQFVMFCVAKGYGGIENLSLIPGTMGAAPMQNIGAYGVEVKDVIHSVEAIDLASGAIKIFGNADCAFGYRESIFKNNVKDKYFISSVTLTLSKKKSPTQHELRSDPGNTCTIRYYRALDQSDQ